jgi:hypothetical protein
MGCCVLDKYFSELLFQGVIFLGPNVLYLNGSHYCTCHVGQSEPLALVTNLSSHWMDSSHREGTKFSNNPKVFYYTFCGCAGTKQPGRFNGTGVTRMDRQGPVTLLKAPFLDGYLHRMRPHWHRSRPNRILRPPDVDLFATHTNNNIRGEDFLDPTPPSCGTL